MNTCKNKVMNNNGYILVICTPKLSLFRILITIIVFWANFAEATFTVTVDAKSNIFVAGGNANINSGLGILDGILPLEITLPVQSDHILTFPSITGHTTCNTSTPASLDGYASGEACFWSGTNILPVNGISGVKHSSRTMFLVGVFLNNSPPSPPPPSTFDLAITQNDSDIYPILNQTFFIGNGLTDTGSGNLQKFHIPSTATRLFLGFADAGFFFGQPGFYSDNQGALTVTYEINTPPVASHANMSLNPTGTPTFQVGETLHGNYTYNDLENDPEGTSIFQWYTATDVACTIGKAAISSATHQTYTITNNEVGQYLCFEVTPVAMSGDSPGIATLTISGKISSTNEIALSPNTVNLTINFSGSGKGNIKSFSNGIDCDKPCHYAYEMGTLIALTPMAASGSYFSKWAGEGCSSSLTLTHHTTCTAIFDILPPNTPSSSPTTPPTLSLEVSIEGLGEVDMTSQQSHLRCTKEHQPCWKRYNTGTLITLVPVAASGYAFSSWGGHDDCADGRVTLSESSRLCVAYFRKLLELSVNNIGEGKVIGEGIDCGNECTEFYATGTSVTLVAIPDQNSIFKAWQGDCDENGHTVMNTHKSCQAVFVARPEPLPDPSSPESPIEMIASPDPPLSETIEPIAKTSSSVTCPPPEEAVTKREASAQEIPTLPLVTLEVAQEGEGEIQSEPAGIVCGPTCTQDYLPGTSVMLTAIPAHGFIFMGWSKDCEGLDLITTVLMNTHQSCMAHFSPIALNPFISSMEKEQFPCPPEEMLNWICNAQGRTLKQELEIRSWGNLSNAVVVYPIYNQGWASNLVVRSSSEVVGGTLTGYISNAGLLKNFEFRGAAIFGGTLAGEIINTSEVGGYFQDIHLAAQTHLIGGRLKGRIIGEPEAPASLDHLTLMSGSHLSGVKLGQEVVIQKNVIVEPLTLFPTLGPATLRSLPDQRTQITSSQFSGGIAVNDGNFENPAIIRKFSDAVTIAGNIQVIPEQVGQLADLVVYAVEHSADKSPRYLMLNAHRGWSSWDGQWIHLAPFRQGVTLTKELAVELYQGIWMVEGEVKFYFGYRLGEGTLVENSQAIEIQVVE